MNTDRDFAIMRRAAREEFERPLNGEPNWQAAWQGYLVLGGTEIEEPGDVQQLFREACEAENLDY